MSRWYHSNVKIRKNNSTIWVNTPLNIYKVTTAQEEFIVRAKRLDYKQTIENLKNAGFTDITITHMGRDVTWKAN